VIVEPGGFVIGQDGRLSPSMNSSPKLKPRQR
jgi:hypothetical protein